MRVTPENITEVANNEVFVFGSNWMGAHNAGAANLAMNKFGAINGQAFGLQGRSFAINSMSGLNTMKQHIKLFIYFAESNHTLNFFVTEIGCGIAGYAPKDIAPFFETAKELENVFLPKRFWDILNNVL